MIRALAAAGTAVGLLVPENVALDLEQGRLRWLPLSDAEADSRIGLYQRTGQSSTVATGVFVQFLDEALGALPSAVRNG